MRTVIHTHIHPQDRVRIMTYSLLTTRTVIIKITRTYSPTYIRRVTPTHSHFSHTHAYRHTHTHTHAPFLLTHTRANQWMLIQAWHSFNFTTLRGIAAAAFIVSQLRTTNDQINMSVRMFNTYSIFTECEFKSFLIGKKMQMKVKKTTTPGI